MSESDDELRGSVGKESVDDAIAEHCSGDSRNDEEFIKSPSVANDADSEDDVVVRSARRKMRFSTDDEGEEHDDEGNEDMTEAKSDHVPSTESKDNKRRHSAVDSDLDELDSDVDKVVADVFGEDYENNSENEEANNNEQYDSEATDVGLSVANNNAALPEKDTSEGVGDGQEGDDEEESEHKDKNIVYDFDVIMQQRKERSRKYRRSKKDSTIVNDMDDIACQLVEKMKIVADEDRMLNRNRLPATNKLRLLPTVLEQVSKPDVLYSMLDNDLLRAICEWLSPMPDKSLPNIKIREGMIRILQLIGPLNVDHLRDSGIGKAVMYLCKHPKEAKENKVKLGKLINEWSRTVFSLDTNYTTLSKEERQQRDLDHQPTSLKKRRVVRHNVNLGKALKAATNEGPKPGDPEFCIRARVPRPAPCDYVYRPVSKISDSTKVKVGTKSNRLEQFKRKAIDFKRKNQVKSAVKFSLNGAKA